MNNLFVALMDCFLNIARIIVRFDQRLSAIEKQLSSVKEAPAAATSQITDQV